MQIKENKINNSLTKLIEPGKLKLDSISSSSNDFNLVLIK